MSFCSVNWGDNPHYAILESLNHIVYICTAAGINSKNSSTSEETRPRGWLPQVGEEGDPTNPTAFETSSLLSEAGFKMLEGASQEILSREVSASDADQDYSAVTSGDDVSQAPEVSPIHDTAVADSESRDSDVGTAADLTSTGTERLEEVQAG